ncbi:signal transduction histidine kinase, nitrogen specific, NtrB [Novosphingobium nitrogenifigens DSM 19370]|uniref:histidine kinase n=1 Tax=Novosphingobium nitrogenifigens DSM 19370 TaxID=983920 RepID=F1Z9Z0_9SPHN|nr:ATP-binding protein [Novosphingobium nitrogenifigens]EGD58602.1 signal transduction histidine kinase, nitrogen specific, NtrB [Novosphingobium nitrogenifigens DSM 19370]
MNNPFDWRRGDAGRPDPKRLVASLPLAMFVLAPDFTVSSVNPAGEQLAGQGARRLVGRQVGELFAFDEPLILERIGGREANLFARDVGVRMHDQPPRRLDVITAPVAHYPGWQMLVLQEPVGVEALTRGGGAGVDDSDGPALRAPAVLAHEIKNPLAGIRGAAQLLDRRIGEKDRALTGLITTEVDRIAKLIDQMQSLSRRSQEPAVECNLHEAVRHAQAILAAGQSGRFVVEEEFDPSLPPIMANPDALVQVLLNLMSNARDACAGAEVPRIAVRTRFASGIQVHTGPGGKPLRLPIELRVSDNGKGVEPALRDHLFEPFVTSKKSGQGLGLALVQKLVREMNGRVTHDRDENRGWTHFRLHLPVAGSVPERNAMLNGAGVTGDAQG